MGKGLDALIPELQEEKESQREQSQNIAIEKIDLNPHQPRKNYSKQGLEELASSIRAYGVIQPVIVKANKERYQLVAGERRYRAAKLAGLKELPALIKELTDSQMMQLALLENLQREDLNPVDKSEALSELIEKYGLTQEKLSNELGISRSSLANILRLQHLHDSVREYLRDGKISEGHARALLSLEQNEQAKMAEEIINRGMSVREVENSIKDKKNNAGKNEKAQQRKDPFIREIEDKLTRALGTKVRIQRGKQKSKVEIECLNDSDLEEIVSRLTD